MIPKILKAGGRIKCRVFSGRAEAPQNIGKRNKREENFETIYILQVVFGYFRGNE